MPYLVQFHDADRFNPARLSTKALNVVPRALNPAHHRCMRYACQTGNAAKPDTFEVKTNTVYPCFNRRAVQRALRIVTAAIFFAFDVATAPVFYYGCRNRFVMEADMSKVKPGIAAFLVALFLYASAPARAQQPHTHAFWNKPGYSLGFEDSALDQPEVFAGLKLSMNWSGQNRSNPLHSSRLSLALDLNRDWQADPQIYRRASLFELGVTASGDEYMMLAGHDWNSAFDSDYAANMNGNTVVIGLAVTAGIVLALGLALSDDVGDALVSPLENN